MAQTTILAAGTTAATSTAVPVAAGASVILSMFVASGAIPASVSLDVNLVTTAGADAKMKTLDAANPVQIVQNPTNTAITINVTRPSLAASGYGVGAIAIA